MKVKFSLTWRRATNSEQRCLSTSSVPSGLQLAWWWGAGSAWRILLQVLTVVDIWNLFESSVSTYWCTSDDPTGTKRRSERLTDRTADPPTGLIIRRDGWTVDRSTEGRLRLTAQKNGPARLTFRFIDGGKWMSTISLVKVWNSEFRFDVVHPVNGNVDCPVWSLGEVHHCGRGSFTVISGWNNYWLSFRSKASFCILSSVSHQT